MTSDIWHFSHDMYVVVNIVLNFSSLALTVWELCGFKDLEEKRELVSYLVNNKSVCGTAWAIPSLFKSYEYVSLYY